MQQVSRHQKQLPELLERQLEDTDPLLLALR
jgi:hypothetical protein